MFKNIFEYLQRNQWHYLKFIDKVMPLNEIINTLSKVKGC